MSKEKIHRPWQDFLTMPLFFDVGYEDVGIDPDTLKPCAEYFIMIGQRSPKYYPLVLQYRVTKEADDLYCLIDICEDTGAAAVFGVGDDNDGEHLDITEHFHSRYPRNKDLRGYVYKGVFLFPVSPEYKAFVYYMNDFGYKPNDPKNPVPYISLFMRVAVETVRHLKSNFKWVDEFSP